MSSLSRGHKDQIYVSSEHSVSGLMKETVANVKDPLDVYVPPLPSAPARRFSVRSEETRRESMPSTEKATIPSINSKVPPRWKAGMLQRQIGRMSVRRRVRAFSLSDVTTHQLVKQERSISPLVTGSEEISSKPSLSHNTVTVLFPKRNDPKTVKTECSLVDSGSAVWEHEKHSPHDCPVTSVDSNLVQGANTSCAVIKPVIKHSSSKPHTESMSTTTIGRTCSEETVGTETSASTFSRVKSIFLPKKVLDDDEESGQLNSAVRDLSTKHTVVEKLHSNKPEKYTEENMNLKCTIKKDLQQEETMDTISEIRKFRVENVNEKLRTIPKCSK